MTHADLDGKKLYVNMRVKHGDGGKVIRIEGVGRLSATESVITVDWFSGDSGSSVTFENADPNQFKKNDEKKEFTILNRQFTPDFIYIEE